MIDEPPEPPLIARIDRIARCNMGGDHIFKAVRIFDIVSPSFSHLACVLYYEFPLFKGSFRKKPPTDRIVNPSEGHLWEKTRLDFFFIISAKPKLLWSKLPLFMEFLRPFCEGVQDGKMIKIKLGNKRSPRHFSQLFL